MCSLLGLKTNASAMTGFTRCLRKCFRAPAEDWKPLRRDVEKGDSEKVTVKVTAATGGRGQIGESFGQSISCMHVHGEIQLPSKACHFGLDEASLVF